MSGRTYDRSLDLFKGLLVILMSFCHVLQFFVDRQMFPWSGNFETYINLLVFPGFVYAYGAAFALAYPDAPFRSAAPRIARSALKALGAFYLSGIGFRLLFENKPFTAGTVRRVLLLWDIPGWSEFLASFFMLSVVCGALFPLLKSLSQHPAAAAGTAAACLLFCFIPYQKVPGRLLPLLIGTDRYACFPVMQYFPYFLLGMFFHKRQAGRQRLCLWLIAALMTVTGIARAKALGGLPSRFPPDIGWVCLSAIGVVCLHQLSLLLSWAGEKYLKQYDPFRLAVSFGRSSLFYLLTVNLTVFTLAGKGAAPVMKFGDRGLFGYPIAAPSGAFVWALVFLLSARFLASIVRGAVRK